MRRSRKAAGRTCCVLAGLIVCALGADYAFGGPCEGPCLYFYAVLAMLFGTVHFWISGERLLANRYAMILMGLGLGLALLHIAIGRHVLSHHVITPLLIGIVCALAVFQICLDRRDKCQPVVSRPGERVASSVRPRGL